MSIRCDLVFFIVTIDRCLKQYNNVRQHVRSGGALKEGVRLEGISPGKFYFKRAIIELYIVQRDDFEKVRSDLLRVILIDIYIYIYIL